LTQFFCQGLHPDITSPYPRGIPYIGRSSGLGINLLTASSHLKVYLDSDFCRVRSPLQRRDRTRI